MNERRRHLFVVLGVIAAIWLAWRIWSPDLDLEKALRDIDDALGSWTYSAVGLMAFLETGAFVGLVVPGETIVVLGGAIAGQGGISLPLLLAIVWIGAFLGDSVSYLIGRRFGRGLIERHGEILRITPERFAQVERHFEKRGGATILIGRFIGIVRALAPFIAGSSGMRYTSMAPYSVLGTGLWAATFTVLGYVTSRNLNEAIHAAERGSFWFGVFLVTVIALVFSGRFLRTEENRRRLADELDRRLSGFAAGRWLLATARRLEGTARFTWDRLTPGNLGIELTALIAVVAVGGFVFGAYASVIGGDPAPTPGDDTWIEIIDAIRAGWLTSVAEVVTELGAAEVAIGIVALVGGWLAWRSAWEELAVAVLGLAVLLIAVPELKEAFGRERPTGGLVGADGDAYPSGHAAYSVVYAWLGATAAIRVAPSWAYRTALLVGGILLAGVVGLTRVYLGVHYMSDVSGGWGLGAVVFGLLGAIAIVVTHLRNNQGAGAGAEPPAEPEHHASPG